MLRACFLSMLLPVLAQSASAQVNNQPIETVPRSTETAIDPYLPARDVMSDLQEIVTPNGIQETLEIEIGGIRQVLNIRGTDRDNPILLFLHGGPGATEMPVAWTFQRPWEDYFTVVHWDQRGAGKTYRINEADAVEPTLTPDQITSDAINVIQFLEGHLDQRKVFLLGHSWGSVIGLRVAMERPDLLHAYIGMGQIIDFLENEEVGTERVIAAAETSDKADAVGGLLDILPYPDEGQLSLEKTGLQRSWSVYLGGLAAYRKDADFYFHAPRLAPTHNADDREAMNDGSLYSISNLWPQVADVSFKDVETLEVPVIQFLGRHDMTTPPELTETWMADLQAPFKKQVWLEHSAHLGMIEQPGVVFMTLVNDVLPLAEAD